MVKTSRGATLGSGARGGSRKPKSSKPKTSRGGGVSGSPETALSLSQNLDIKEGRVIKLTRGQKAAVSRGGSEAAAFSKLVQSAKKEAETLRTEKRQPQTIAAQIEKGDPGFIGPVRASASQGQRTPDPGTIDVLRPGDLDPSRRFSRGAGESTKAFFGAVGKDIVIIATGLATGRGFGGLVDPFKSFEQTGRQRGEQVVQVPEFGTITTDTGIKEQTLFEIREESERGAGIPEEVIGRSGGAQTAFIGTRVVSDISKDLIGKGQAEFDQSFDILQEKVTAGEISVKRGTEALGAIGTSLETKLGGEFDIAFERQFNIDTSKVRTTSSRLEKRSGETFAAVGREAAIFGGLALASVGAAPLTFSAASVLGGTIAEAKGAERTRDILFGAGVIGGLQAPGAIARSIDIGRLGALESQQLRTLGFQATEGRDTLLLQAGLKQTPFAKQTTEFLIPTFETGITKGGAARFSIGGARGRSTTELESFTLKLGDARGTGIITQKEAVSLTARGIGGLPSTFVKGDLGFQVAEGGAFGRLDLVSGDKIRRAAFGGISRTEGDIIGVVGGRGTRVRAEFDFLTGKVAGKTLKARPEAFGEILKVNLKDIETTRGGFTSFSSRPKGKGIPSLGFETTQLQTQEFASQAGLKAADIISPTIRGGGLGLKDVPAILGGTAVSQFAGTGQDVIQPSTTRLRGDQFSFQAPKVDTFQRGGTLLGFDIKPDAGQRGGQRGAFTTSLSFRDIQESGQTLKTGLSFSPKQIQTQLQATVPPARVGGGFGFDPFSPGFGRGLPPVILPGLPTFGFGRAPTRRIPKRKPGRIAPSLTGIAQFQLGGITGGPLPTTGELGALGLTPGTTRLVPGRKTKKKTKKKK